MNANYHLELLQLAGQIHDAARAGAAVATAVNPPSHASTTHFGPDGRQIAAISTTSYSSVHTGAGGRITGGQVSHSTTDQSGAPIDSSTVNMGADGQVTTIDSWISNRFGPGLHKSVHIDLTGIQWTPASTIGAGTVAVQVRQAATGRLRTQGQVTFASERIGAGRFAHCAWAGDGLVHGYTDVDYSASHVVGGRFTGGYCTITSKDTAEAVRSQSDAFFSPEGRIAEVHTKNFDTVSRACTSQLVAQFDKMEFDARNRFLQGEIHLTVSDPAGTRQSESVTTFAEGRPVRAVTQSYQGSSQTGQVETDFTSATFSNDLAVVSSQAVTSVYDPGGTLSLRSTTSYDDAGNPAKRTVQQLDRSSGRVARTTVTDYSGVQFDHRRTPIGGVATIVSTDAVTGVITTTRRDIVPPAGTPAPVPVASLLAVPPPPAPAYSVSTSELTGTAGAPTSTSQKITRPDGTLLQTVLTQVSDGRPATSVVTSYAPDGTTVTSVDRLDLTSLSFDQDTNVVAGSVAVKSAYRGTVPSATSFLAY